MRLESSHWRREGTSIVGLLRTDGESDRIRLSLLIDGAAVNQQVVDLGPIHKEVRFPIPTEWLDGLTHLLAVIATDSSQILAVMDDVLPGFATPWSSLQRHAGRDLPARHAPAAARRYECLVEWLRSGDLEDSPRAQRLAQLRQAHETLLQGFSSAQSRAPLTFSTAEDPLVSVIVPVHNNAAMTYNCLAALSFAYNQIDPEIIIVDDGSSDETVTLPEIINDVTFVRNESAQGFVRACNHGATHARGAYLVFLNNDTEPTAHWLDELLFPFNIFADVGLTGSKLLFPDGRLQDAGGIVWNSGNPTNYGRNGNAEDPRYNYTRQTDYLSGASIMIPRQVWNDVGGFSEEFAPAYFEDTDLAFKVRAIGKRVVYAPRSVVYHFDGMSSRAGTDPGVKRFQEINRPIFKRRWLYAYRSNGDQGKSVDLVKDRNVHLRALVIDHGAPRPDQDAGSYAAIQEIRLLQSLGCKVTFLPLNLAYLGAYTEMMQRLGVECLHAPFVTSAADLLSARGHEFDVVYITRYTAARRVLKHVRRFAPQAKILFCNADLHFLRTLREALVTQDRKTLEEAKWIRDEELKIMRQVDVVLSYNSTEHTVIQSHNLDKSQLVLAPWVVDVKEDVPPFKERSDVAFLGGFNHPPNLPAARFFIEEVMPLLRKHLSGVRFRVYGSHIPAELEALACDDVLIEGYVDDVAQVYDSCRVFVAPLLTGAGLKGKVVECLAHGTPAVLSPIAAEGIPLQPGQEALLAETPDQWVSAISSLYSDRTVWQEVSNQARAFARETYSFARGRQLMAEALSRVGITIPSTPQALVATTARIERRLESLPATSDKSIVPPPPSTPTQGGDRIVSPNFRVAASHLLTAPLPPESDFVLVSDSDVGPILTDPRDTEIGGWLRERRTWAPAEGHLLRSVLQPGMNVIDIGANIGYFTLLCAYAVGPSGRVLAVEAEPEFCLQLRANVALNNLENVEILPLAAHRQSGMMAIWRNTANFGGSFMLPRSPDSPSTPIQAARLDDALCPDTPIDVIKIDIEGMDHLAVQGLEGTIRRWRPTLLVEYHPLAIELLGEDPMSVFGYYRSLGYQVRVLGTDARRLRDYAGMDLDDFVSHDLLVTAELDARIAELTHPIGLINLVLTPMRRVDHTNSS